MTAKRIFLSHWKVVAIPQYRAIHYWIERRKGKPSYCELCKSKDKKVYHWANKSGKYLKDLSDWRRLCPSCHFREKHPGKCGNGHKLTIKNTYVRPTGFRVWESDGK